MLVLFDHGTPFPIRRFLKSHWSKARRTWDKDRLSSGELLDAAEKGGFDLLLTTDKNIRYQQRLAGRNISILVLSNAQWPVLGRYVQLVVEAVSAATPGHYYEVQIPDR